MTRLGTDGAEAGSLTLDNQFFNVVGSASIVTSPVRSGTYAYSIDGSPAVHSFASAQTEFYVHFAFYVTTSGTNRYFFELTNGIFNDRVLEIGLSEANLLHINIPGVGNALRIGTTAIQPNQWYVLDFYIRIGASGQVTARIDGTQEWDYTGNTRGNSLTTVNHLRWKQCSLDDIAINDTTGGSDNGWIPDIHLVWVLVDGPGDDTELTPTGAGSNWQAVDERPNDGDTSFVASSTTDEKDLYTLASFTSSGNVIRRVQPIAIARETVADGGKLSVGVKSDSTEDWSPDRNLTTNYGLVYGDEYTTDPDDSAAWDDAKVSALQIGVKIR